LKPGQTYQNTIDLPVLSAAIAATSIHQNKRVQLMDNPVTNAAVSTVAVAATNAVATVRGGHQCNGTVFNNLDWFVIACSVWA
jgi:hypothetical protein